METEFLNLYVRIRAAKEERKATDRRGRLIMKFQPGGNWADGFLIYHALCCLLDG